MDATLLHTVMWYCQGFDWMYYSELIPTTSKWPFAGIFQQILNIAKQKHCYLLFIHEKLKLDEL